MRMWKLDLCKWNHHLRQATSTLFFFLEFTLKAQSTAGLRRTDSRSWGFGHDEVGRAPSAKGSCKALQGAPTYSKVSFMRYNLQDIHRPGTAPSIGQEVHRLGENTVRSWAIWVQKTSMILTPPACSGKGE
jgi:hypothetical protein